MTEETSETRMRRILALSAAALLVAACGGSASGSPSGPTPAAVASPSAAASDATPPAAPYGDDIGWTPAPGWTPVTLTMSDRSSFGASLEFGNSAMTHSCSSGRCQLSAPTGAAVVVSFHAVDPFSYRCGPGSDPAAAAAMQAVGGYGGSCSATLTEPWAIELTRP